MTTTDYCFETLCVKGNPLSSNFDTTGAISLPIFQSATFAHPSLGNSTGFDYSRLSNPTRKFLEETVAALDGAKYGFAFTCGMSAITAFFDTVPSGSHVICSDDLYGGTVRLFNTIAKKQGIETTFTDTSNLENIRKEIRPETKVIFIETPGNPLMSITDIQETARIAHQNGAVLVVDNTFLTAYFQKPLALGADVVIQSGTKFLCGHNDTLAGFVTTNNEKIAEDLTFITKTTGSALPPFDSWLVVRGIKTLSVRLERQQANAKKIISYLKTEKHVKKILYPALESASDAEIQKKQATGNGSMISFYVDSAETVEKILRNVKLIRFAESLGGVESLITYPLTQTHSELPEELRTKKGISNTLLRLSVGIEEASDLISDLQNAMNGN